MKQPIALILARHGECEKNADDRHGGPGGALTERGHEQMHQLAQQLTKDFPALADLCTLWTADADHLHASAASLGRYLSLQVAALPGLRGIDLGVLTGLSTSEARSKYPVAAASLDSWRQGSSTLDDLDVPGLESVDAFRARVSAALSQVTCHLETAAIILASRSALIMLVNILALGDRFSPARYRPYEIPEGSMAIWQATPQELDWRAARSQWQAVSGPALHPPGGC